MKIHPVLEDALRAEGADDEMLQWLRHPDAVRTLLRATNRPSRESLRLDNGWSRRCRSCNFAGVHAHDCAVLLAQIQLDPARMQEEIEEAHDEALVLVLPQTTTGVLLHGIVRSPLGR